MGEGSGRGSGQTFGQQSRVGSGRVNVLPGRVQEKWPVDNSALHRFRGRSAKLSRKNVDRRFHNVSYI